eukprot:1600557-Karenia_brevis.AAC.1
MATKRRVTSSSAVELFDEAKSEGKATKQLESRRTWDPDVKEDTRTTPTGMATEQSPLQGMATKQLT